MSDFGQLMIEFAQNGFYVFPNLTRFKSTKYMPKNWNHKNPDITTGFESSNDVVKVMDWLNHDDIIGFGVHRNLHTLVVDVDCGAGKPKA